MKTTRQLFSLLPRLFFSLVFAAAFYTAWLAVAIPVLKQADNTVLIRIIFWLAAPPVTAAGFTAGIAIAQLLPGSHKSSLIQIYLWPLVGCFLGEVIVLWFSTMFIVLTMMAFGAAATLAREIHIIKKNQQPATTCASTPIKPKNLAAAYLAIWLGTGLIPFSLHIFARPDYVKLSTAIFAGLANLFGLWATIIVKASDFPNAGEFFHPLHTSVYSAFILAVVIIPFLIRKRLLQILALLLFVPMIVFWLYLGWAQLASCAI